MDCVGGLKQLFFPRTQFLVLCIVIFLFLFLGYYFLDSAHHTLKFFVCWAPRMNASASLSVVSNSL